MCVSPSTLRSGVVVGCRRCWQCLSNRVEDWAGRNIAETKTAVRSYALRLSYGRSRDGQADHLHSVMLFASDMQRFVKRLRSKRFGYKVRYMIAGEYGSTFGRAHWHGIFHFYGENLPAWDGYWKNWSDEQWDKVGGVHIPEWAYDDGEPVGHVHIKPATYASVRYALKYILKDQQDPHAALKVLMSKYPPLGAEYLADMARDVARAGLAPRDLFYRFPVITYNGTEAVRTFYMRGKVAEVYVKAYIDEWRRLHGDKPHPGTGDSDTDPVGVYLRFGRLGKSELLLEKDLEDRLSDAKFAKMEEEALRSPTMAEHLNKGSKLWYKDHWAALDQWERKYFGKETRQREGTWGSFDFNDPLVLSYLCWRYDLTERQLWAASVEQLDAWWRNAERDIPGAVQAFRRNGGYWE